MQTLLYRIPMMHGPAVKRLQEFGDLLGYDYGKNDGIFGKETELVVKSIQRRFGLEPDGICGPKTWEAVLGYFDENVIFSETKPGNMFDIRNKHDKPRLFSHVRPWTKINGITIHQTGCSMPKSPTGWSRLNAHIGITTDGIIVFVNDCTDMIWHAQGLSHSTVGIEIAGNFCGIDCEDRTLWKGGGPAAKLTDKQKTAAMDLLDFLMREFQRNGQKIQRIYAHRQAYKTRIGDPGSEIWQKIAIPWQQKTGATDGGPEWLIGSGRPIPKEWNPYYYHGYWKK